MKASYQLPNDKGHTCRACETDLDFVSDDVVVEQKYDYKLTTKYDYYKCPNCDKMFDERISSTGLRNLSLANREKAEKFAIQRLN